MDLHHGGDAPNSSAINSSGQGADCRSTSAGADASEPIQGAPAHTAPAVSSSGQGADRRHWVQAAGADSRRSASLGAVT